jgi:hypothetical protein
MDLRNPFIFSLSRFNPGQPSRRTASFQLLHNSAQSMRRLRVPSPHVMVEIRRMVNKPRLTHKCSILSVWQDDQNGCPGRPQRVKPRGVPLRYVEGLNDARTKLADFFSVLQKSD